MLKIIIDPLSGFDTYIEQDGDANEYNFVVEFNQPIITSGDGLWSSAVRAVKVKNFGIWFSTDGDDGDAGDFYVTYDGSGKDGTWNDGANLENNGTLLNVIKDEAASDGLIYTDTGFIESVREVMKGLGEFDDSVIDDIGYSEQGMQEDGRVSFDAYDLVVALRAKVAAVYIPA